MSRISVKLSHFTPALAALSGVLLLSACATGPEEAVSDGSAESVATVAPSTPDTGPAAGSKDDFLNRVQDRVFFDYDRSNLDQDARNTLDRQIAWLKTYPRQTVVVEGHCDERGTRAYNIALGERRATAVRDYMVARGLDPSRITTISYGKERPAVLGNTERSYRLNRRGVTVIAS